MSPISVGERISSPAVSFSIGDIVLSRMKGYPPWPGRIVDPDSVPKGVRKERPKTSRAIYCVHTFGENKFAWQFPKSLSHLTPREINQFLNETPSKDPSIMSAYKIARDPVKWENEMHRDREERKQVRLSASAEQAGASEGKIKPKKRKSDNTSSVSKGKQRMILSDEDPSGDEGSDDEDGVDDKEYIVEYLLEARPSLRVPGTWRYFIKWYGYEEEENTWGEEEDLQNCRSVVKGFWEHVGVERKALKKYSSTKPIKSSASWQASQTERARKENGPPPSKGEDSEPESRKPNPKGPVSKDTDPNISLPLEHEGTAMVPERSAKDEKDLPGSQNSSTSKHPSQFLKALSSHFTKKSPDVQAVVTQGNTNPPPPSESSKKRKATSDDKPIAGPSKKPREGETSNENSSDDSLFHDGHTPGRKRSAHARPSSSRQRLVESPPTMLSSLPREKEKGGVNRNRSRSSSTSSVDVPLSQNQPEPRATTARTLYKPGDPVIDKHRGSRLKVLPAEITAVPGLKSKFSVTTNGPSRAPSNKPTGSKRSPLITASGLPRQSSADRQPTPSLPLEALTLTTLPELPSLRSPVVRSTISPTASSTSFTPLEPLPSLDILTTGKDASNESQKPVTVPRKPGRRGASDFMPEIKEPPPSEAPVPPKPPPVMAPRISKKWTGNLVLTSGGPPYCEISVESVQSSIAVNKIMPTILKQLTELKATATFPGSSVAHFLLPAFEAPNEFSRVGSDSVNSPKLTALLTYLEYEHRVAVIYPEVSVHSNYFLLYPSNMAEVSVALDTPLSIQRGTLVLVLAMLVKSRPRPFSLPTNEFLSFTPSGLTAVPKERGLLHSPHYQRVAQYFGLDQEWLDYFSGRTFCIFSAHNGKKRPSLPIPSTQQFDDPESKALTYLLESHGAKRVDWLDSTNQIIFIHNNNWFQTGNALPDQLMHKGTHFRLQFFKFGVSTTFWPGENERVCEVFPTGGVLSFTAGAIAENPERLLDLIERVASHPLWQVYVWADTIALLAHFAEDRPNGAAVALAGLLTTLKYSHGNICISSSPPEPYEDDRYLINAGNWVKLQYEVLELRDKPSSLVEHCHANFERTYSDLLHPVLPNSSAKAELGSAIETAAIKDMANLQRQPAMYTTYRQFVLICDGNPPGTTKDGIGVLTLDQFTFPDDEDRQPTSGLPNLPTESSLSISTSFP